MSEEFINWLQSNGARFPKLKIIKTTDNYRSVYTVNLIDRGELICYIPVKCIITKEYSKNCEWVKMLESKGYYFHNEHDLLALSLLYEKKLGKSSFWSHYISSLPKEFPTNPVFFSTEDLEKMKGSGAYDKVIEKLNELNLSYEILNKLEPEIQFSREEYIWARTIVITRVFGFKVNGVQESGLVPLADMLNHQHPDQVNTSWSFNDKLRGFVISSTSKIKNGVEVFDTYGKKCNYRFFVNYGFFLDNIRNDEEVVMNINNIKYQLLFRLRPHLEKDRYANMITLGELIKKLTETMTINDCLQLIKKSCEEKLNELPVFSVPQSEKERIMKRMVSSEHQLVKDILYFSTFCLDIYEKISENPNNKKSITKKAKTKCRSFYVHEIDYFLDKYIIKM